MSQNHLPEPNLEPTIERFQAWWANALADRPPVTFMWVGKDGAAPPNLPYDHERFLVDGALRLELFEQSLHLRTFPGDSFPMFSAGITADHNGTVFGLQLGSSKASVWAIHFAESIEEVQHIKASLDNPYWKSIQNATDLSLERGRDRWITTLCCHGGMNADIYVALRGPENACMDLVDDPEGVRNAILHLSQAYPLVYNDIQSRISAAGQPISSEGELSRKRTARIGCDFLCMISPEMAAESVYPAIELELDGLDEAYFHLDSQGSLNHLDFILDQPKIKAVQWVYGVNRGPASQWIEVYQRIQNAGKALEILPTSVHDAMELMQFLNPQGTWFKFLDPLPHQEAEAFVKASGIRRNWAE